jgi:rhamnogalacturonyl hydrolase YesR
MNIRTPGGLRACLSLVLAALFSVSVQAAEPVRLAWEILPAREIRPEGWMKTMWSDDFAHGLPRSLDVINCDVTKNLFAAQNCGMDSVTWWPAEQEGYWYEAYIHAAFQFEDAAAIQTATQWVDGILAGRGPDGYLGIYAPSSRLLPPDDQNYGPNGGELHTQAHLFLALIAFYEHTQRADVLAAVEQAAQLTMSHYPDGPFATTDGRTRHAGGNSHSVSFADPMMQLYRITGDESYLRFVATAYESYSKHPPRDNDFVPAAIDNPRVLLQRHGAHTAEAFHWLSALTVAGDPKAEARAANAMQRLERSLTPGGALICDEFVIGRLGNGYDLYEYCAQAELIKSLTWIAQYQGDTLAAERAARLFFNGAMGARLHPLTGLQYLSCDNRLDIPAFVESKAANKDAAAKKEETKVKHFQIRSLVRPTCCPASSGRPVHYFLSGAWMKRPADHALALMNFMPCTLQTELAGVQVAIAERTLYPFSDQVRLEFTLSEPTRFPIAIRLPAEGTLQASALPGLTQETRGGFLWLTKSWQTGDAVTLDLQLPVVLEKTQDGQEFYYRRGALTYALPFDAKLTKVTENPDWRTGKPSGFYEYDVAVADKSAWGSRIDPQQKFQPVTLPGDPQNPWTRPVAGLRGNLIDPEGRPFEVTLVPEAASISRRVTFFDTTHTAAEAAMDGAKSDVSIGN